MVHLAHREVGERHPVACWDAWPVDHRGSCVGAEQCCGGGLQHCGCLDPVSLLGFQADQSCPQSVPVLPGWRPPDSQWSCPGIHQ